VTSDEKKATRSLNLYKVGQRRGRRNKLNTHRGDFLLDLHRNLAKKYHLPSIKSAGDHVSFAVTSNR
jgi:hypothetical protein